MRPDAWYEAGASELVERVVAAIRRHDVMAGLVSAVETDDCRNPLGLGKVVGDAAFARITETEVRKDGCAVLGMHRNSFGRGAQGPAEAGPWDCGAVTTAWLPCPL